MRPILQPVSQPILSSAFDPVVGGSGDVLRIIGNLPDGVVGEPYNATLTVSGGVPPYTLGDVVLPTGLSASLDGATITVDGTPTEEFDGEVSFGVTDSLGAEGDGDWPVKVTRQFLPETIHLLDRFENEASLERKELTNQTISLLLNSGIWEKMDVAYFWSGDDEQSSLLNWKGDQFTAQKVGSPEFSPLYGFTGNGGALNTTFNPVTSSGVYSTNDAFAGVWLQNGSPATGQVDFGSQQTRLCAWAGGELVSVRGNSSTGATPDLNISSAEGLLSFSRESGDGYSVQKDLGPVAELTAASSVTNLPFYALAISAAGPAISQPSSRQQGALLFGSSLTKEERDDLYYIVSDHIAGPLRLLPGITPSKPSFSDIEAEIEGLPASVSSSVLGQDEGGYDIYKLESGEAGMPCMFITAGLHGSEWGSVSLAIEFIRRFSSSDAPEFKWMRRNIRVVVLPCVNGWGLETTSYNNYNGFNLNRNFTRIRTDGLDAWTAYAESAPNNLKGPYAFSESGSQVVKAEFDFQSPLCAIDVHTNAGIFGMDLNKVIRNSGGHFELMTAVWGDLKQVLPGRNFLEYGTANSPGAMGYYSSKTNTHGFKTISTILEPDSASLYDGMAFGLTAIYQIARRSITHLRSVSV